MPVIVAGACDRPALQTLPRLYCPKPELREQLIAAVRSLQCQPPLLKNPKIMLSYAEFRVKRPITWHSLSVYLASSGLQTASFTAINDVNTHIGKPDASFQ